MTIALIVADITNPVVFGIVRGAEKAASASGYTLVIAESQESGAAEAEAVERLIPSVDGIILATTRLDDQRINDIAARKRVVLINRAVAGVDDVLPDVRSGVAQLMDHLNGLGHRSVAYLSGPEGSWISARRWELMCEAADAHGMSLVRIGPIDPTIPGGHAALDGALATGATAIVGFNDLIAIGIMQAAARRSIRIPAELSVAGFDDIFGSELIVPALTTVRSQLSEAGERAVRAILADLDHADSGRPAAQLLETALVVRQSTAVVPTPV